jgi:hypothetical protein
MSVFGHGDRWVAVANQKAYARFGGTTGNAAAVIAVGPMLKGDKACVNIPNRAELQIVALEPAIRDVLFG